MVRGRDVTVVRADRPRRPTGQSPSSSTSRDNIGRTETPTHGVVTRDNYLTTGPSHSHISLRGPKLHVNVSRVGSVSRLLGLLAFISLDPLTRKPLCLLVRIIVPFTAPCTKCLGVRGEICQYSHRHSSHQRECRSFLIFNSETFKYLAYNFYFFERT